MKKIYRNVIKKKNIFWMLLLVCMITGCSGEDEIIQEESQLDEAVECQENTVEFNDPIFEKAIRRELNQKDIYESDLSEITSLSINGYKKISDLSDLEKFQNLEELAVTGCEISDISIIEKLPHLVKVDFSHNRIQSVQNINVPDTLKYLILSDNKITELTFLEEFPQITLLNLSGNKIENIKGVEYCTHLQYLDLRDNKISDVKGIDVLTELHTLYLDEEVERIGYIDFMIGNFRNGDVTTKQYLLKEQYDLE